MNVKRIADALRALADAIEAPPDDEPAPTLVELLNVDEIAERYRVTRRSVLDAHRAGRLETMGTGRQIVATKTAVETWLSCKGRHREKPVGDDLPTLMQAFIERRNARRARRRNP